MSVNRIVKLLKEVAAAEGAEESQAGFTVNPFGAPALSWQMQIYQAAFLQAKKAAEQENKDDWPMAEWWS